MFFHVVSIEFQNYLQYGTDQYGIHPPTSASPAVAEDLLVDAAGGGSFSFAFNMSARSFKVKGLSSACRTLDEQQRKNEYCI